MVYKLFFLSYPRSYVQRSIVFECMFTWGTPKALFLDLYYFWFTLMMLLTIWSLSVGYFLMETKFNIHKKNWNEFNFTLNHNLSVLDKWSKVYITKMKTWRLKFFIYTKCCIKVSSRCSESRHATSIKQFRKSVSFSSQITCIFFIWSAFA